MAALRNSEARQLNDIEHLRREHVQGAEEAASLRTLLKMQNEVWSRNMDEMESEKQVAAERSEEVHELKAKAEVLSEKSEALTTKNQELSESLTRSQKDVAEQIKRGRHWWTRSKTLTDELQAKEAEMARQDKTHKEMK
ncbi:unnamed protein product, partial [Symbiodinium sp. CCMP2456]